VASTSDVPVFEMAYDILENFQALFFEGGESGRGLGCPHGTERLPQLTG